MRRLVFSWLGLVAAIFLAGQSFAQLTSTGAGKAPSGGGGGCTPGTNASNFLARTSGLDATHTAAYCVLINGLDTDGLYTKFDLLYVFATQDSTTALLNIPDATYNAVTHGSPTFTADSGFTGVDASTTVFIDNTFHPGVGGHQYTQNSAHISVWNLTNAASGAGGGAVFSFSDGVSTTRLFPKYADGAARVDVNTSGADPGVAVSDPRGLIFGNRSGANALQVYLNTTNIQNQTGGSASIGVGLFDTILANNVGGTINFGGGYQIAIVTLGASFNSTEEGNLYNRLCTYMTTVHGSC